MEVRFVPRSRRSTGRGWMMGLLRHLWRLSRDIWDYRNHLAHDGLDSLVRRELDEVDADIVAQFRQGRDGLRAQVSRHYFGGGLHCMLLRTAPAKKAWLYGITAARERQMRRWYGDDAVSTEWSRRLLLRWIGCHPRRCASRLVSLRSRRRGNANGPDQREPD